MIGASAAAACTRSLFPFPAEPYTAAVRASKRTAHHLITYYTVRLDSSRAVRLSAAECDAAVWVPLSHLPPLLDAEGHRAHYHPAPAAATSAAEAAEDEASGQSACAIESTSGVPAQGDGHDSSRDAAATALPSKYSRALCDAPPNHVCVCCD